MSTQDYPLEMSEKGNNTHYVACEHRKCQQNYAICLNVNKAFNEGRRKPSDYCSKEISSGVCEAAKMRAQEIAAGHTLYYVPRVAVDVSRPANKAYGLRPKPTLQPVATTKRFSEPHSDELRSKSPVTVAVKKKPLGELSDVLNQMMAEHVEGRE